MDDEYTITKEQAQEMWDRAWNYSAYKPYIERKKSMDRYEIIAEVHPRSVGYVRLLGDDEIADMFEEHGYFVVRDPARDGSLYIMRKKEE